MFPGCQLYPQSDSQRFLNTSIRWQACDIVGHSLVLTLFVDNVGPVGEVCNFSFGAQSQVEPLCDSDWCKTSSEGLPGSFVFLCAGVVNTFILEAWSLTVGLQHFWFTKCEPPSPSLTSLSVESSVQIVGVLTGYQHPKGRCFGTNGIKMYQAGCQNLEKLGWRVSLDRFIFSTYQHLHVLLIRILGDLTQGTESLLQHLPFFSARWLDRVEVLGLELKFWSTFVIAKLRVFVRHGLRRCALPSYSEMFFRVFSEWLRLQRLFLLQRGSTHRHSLAEGLYNFGRIAQLCDIIAALAAPAMSQFEPVKIAWKEKSGKHT